MALTDYSTNPANNGVVVGVTYWPEGMLPSQVDDTGRRTMADLAVWLRAPLFLGVVTRSDGTTTYTLVDSGNLLAVLGYTPVQQGTGIGQLSNAVKLGWDGSAVRATVDSTDQGKLVTDTLANGGVLSFNGASMRRNGQNLYGPDNLDLSTKQNALGFTPVQQGTGSGQLGNTVKIGWDGVCVRAQVDTSDLGRLATEVRIGAASALMPVNGTSMRRNGSDLWGSDNFNPAAKQDVLGYAPVQQGTGVSQLGNAVKIGWDGGGLRATVDTSDQGHIPVDASGRSRCIITDGTAAPSGGSDGDIYFQYS